MSYGMKQRGSNFFIAAENKPAALEAIKELSGRHFDWVKTFIDARTLEIALQAWRWGTETDDENNIMEITFEGQNSGDEKILFTAIAPFVREGSYIEMVGEEGDLWRWTFKGGQMEEQSGRISFGDETYTVLITDHSDGQTVTIHRTLEGAKAALIEYVREYWQKEVGDDDPIPDDPTTAIRAYFEATEDEDYTIVEDVEVLP